MKTSIPLAAKLNLFILLFLLGNTTIIFSEEMISISPANKQIEIIRSILYRINNDPYFLPYPYENINLSQIQETLQSMRNNLHQFQTEELEVHIDVNDIPKRHSIFDILEDREGESLSSTTPMREEPEVETNQVSPPLTVASLMMEDDYDMAAVPFEQEIEQDHARLFVKEFYHRYAPDISGDARVVYLEVYRKLMRDFTQIPFHSYEQQIYDFLTRIRMLSPEDNPEGFITNAQDFLFQITVRKLQTERWFRFLRKFRSMIENTLGFADYLMSSCQLYDDDWLQERVNHSSLSQILLDPLFQYMNWINYRFKEWDIKAAQQEWIEKEIDLENDTSLTWMDRFHYYFKQGNYHQAGAELCNKYLLVYEHYEKLSVVRDLLAFVYGENPDNVPTLKQLAKDHFDKGFEENTSYSREAIVQQINSYVRAIENNQYEEAAKILGYTAGIRCRIYIWEYFQEYKFDDIELESFNSNQKNIYQSLQDGFKNRIQRKMRWWITTSVLIS